MIELNRFCVDWSSINVFGLCQLCESAENLTEVTTEEAQLSIKDRLNFPYILANQILTFQKSILAQDFSEREIEEAIKGFVHLVPDSWKDKIFHKDLKNASITRRLDKRPQITGTVKMSEDVCKELGIVAYEDKTVFDYYKMFQACINLLQRRRMLSKVNPVEEIDFVELEEIGEAEATSTRKDNVQSQ